MSVYAGEPIDRLLTAAPGANRSARVNAAVERYLDIVEAEAAPLTEAQMQAVLDVAPADVDGWPALLGVVAASGVPALLSRLLALSQAQRAAVLEGIARNGRNLTKHREQCV